jgi:hypothetical protein
MEINLEWIFKEVKHPRLVLFGIFIVGFILGRMW